MTRWCTAGLALVFLVGPDPSLACRKATVTGYFKNFSVAFHNPPLDGLIPDLGTFQGVFSNRLRVNLSCEMVDWSSFTVAYDLTPRIQSQRLIQDAWGLGQTGQRPYRVSDFRSRIYPSQEPVHHVGLFHNLDRAFVTFRLPEADIYVGRQAIAWGSARAVNPTDILTPFAYNEVDAEDRVGVDALRVRIPVGTLGELDTGYVVGPHGARDQSAGYLRGRWNQWRTDWSMMLAGFQENLMVGFDFARGVGGAGVWFEGAYVFAGALKPRTSASDADYFRGTWGIDYGLSNGTYLYVEYHYSQAGAGDPPEYLGRLSQIAFSEGAVYLMGRHYLAPGVTYPLTPLINLQGGALLNLGDGSLLLAPEVDYGVTKNVYLSAGAYLGIGSGPVFSATSVGFPPGAGLRSEFGSYPDLYFASLRVYF